MVNAQQLVEKAFERQQGYDIRSFLQALRACNQGAMEDVLNRDKSGYYQWLPCLIDQLKPSQVVELGGAMGVSALMMLSAKYKDFDLWSITLQEHGLEFAFVADNYPRLHMVIGDDLDLGNWARKLDLGQTDLWFYDALHTEEHLRAELELYAPFHKKGAVLLFDDIHSFGLDPVWEDLKSGKYGQLDCFDGTDRLHYSGYGVAIVL